MTYFKTTIVIFSEFDPDSQRVEIDRLANEAMSGVAICTEQRTEIVSPNALPDDVASFFDVD